MDVAVDQKRGKGRLQSIAHATLLGDGMLERARATTLGLLGAAGAVGLMMIALVFNQAWPLVAGGPVPPLPPREQAVAKAQVVATTSAQRQAVDGAASRPRDDGGHGAGTELSQAPENDSTPAPSSELVVVPAAPVDRQGDAPPSGGHASPGPAGPKATTAPPAQTETAEPAPTSPPAQAPAPELAPPATVSEAPESSVPPWSHGKGHAYGRSEGLESASYDDDEDSHGHGHGYGHDDD